MIRISVNESEAEEVLIALNHRAKQVGIMGTQMADEIIALGKGLSEVFEDRFGWDKGVFDRHRATKIAVTVRRLT